MDPIDNPYSPGAGVRPAHLSGRDTDLESFRILVERAERRRPQRSVILHGLRSVGKTVLLHEMGSVATKRKWLTVSIEAESDINQFLRTLATKLAHAARKNWLERATEPIKQALASITSFQATVGAAGISLGVERQLGTADSGDPQLDLLDLARTVGEAAAEQQIGIAILIDEMQDLAPGLLKAICQSCHHAGQQNLPWFVIGAGLPDLPTRLAEAESYAERLFDYRTIAPLTDTAARAALTNPAEPVTWEPAAAEFVLGESRGYPYFIQQFGETTWNVAIGTDGKITLEDAMIGVTEGQAKLDAGFYRSRWDRATPAERKMLQAMQADGDSGSAIADVARRMKKKRTSALGPARAKLISKGIIYAPEHGRVAYTVPGMADFVARIESR